MIPVAVARWTWMLLIALQLVWFGWLYPSSVIGLWPALLLATVPLLVPLPWILRLSRTALVVGGMILLLHFSFAVSEAWSNPEVRILALVEIGLVAVYFLALPAYGRRSRPETNNGR